MEALAERLLEPEAVQDACLMVQVADARLLASAGWVAASHPRHLELHLAREHLSRGETARHPPSQQRADGLLFPDCEQTACLALRTWGLSVEA